MKLWLDDTRLPPEGWLWAKTAREAIALLETDPCEEISLDHDLADLDHSPEETGYTVLVYLESRVVWDDAYVAPKIHIHTDNAAVIPKMRLGIASIERFMRLKEK